MQPFLKCAPLAALCLLALAGCASSEYSPNTYASNAVQYANKVEPGIVVGYRQVAISANGNIGAVTGAAAGGVLGSEYAGTPLAAVGGTAVGALVGSALDHAAGDTTGWEYIVRKHNGDMLSVTQREKRPLELGQRVLVIVGPQARVVPDYSTPPEPAVKAEAHPESRADPKPQNVKVEVVLSLPPGVTAQSPTGQVSGLPATAISTEDGQAMVVRLPVIGAVTPSGAVLVPVSAMPPPAEAGAVTADPNEGRQAPPAANEAARDPPAVAEAPRAQN